MKTFRLLLGLIMYSLRYHPEFDITSIPAGRITENYIQSSGNQVGIMFIQKHYELSNEFANALLRYQALSFLPNTTQRTRNTKVLGT